MTTNREIGISIEELLEIVRRFQRLLVLLTGKSMHFSFIEFQIVENTSEGETISVVRYFFRQLGKINRISSPNDQRFLLQYNDIKNNLEKTINNWFIHYDSNERMSIGFIYDQFTYSNIETKIVNVVKGLEVFHTCYRSDKREESPLLREETEKVRTFILGTVSDTNKEYFLRKIKSSKYNNLFDKIRELVTELPNRIKSLIFGTATDERINEFIRQTVDTRNYFTHRGSKSNYPKAATDFETMNLLLRNLTIVFRYHLLTQLGIDTNVVENSLIEFEWVYR